jgi:hypothetical protein
MCNIKKNVTVEDMSYYLNYIADQLLNTADEIKGTIVKDENYISATAIIGNQVVCINFMN